MTLWKVEKYYHSENNNAPVYEIAPYNLKGHLKCCSKYYGFSGLKWCYLSKKRAERKAATLNNRIK